MTKLLVMFFALFLSSKDFGVREFATDLLYFVSQKIDADDAIIEVYKESEDVEVKDRLYRIYYDTPCHIYPDIHEVATYVNNNFGYITTYDPKEWLSITNGDKYKAGEFAWYNFINLLEQERIRLMNCCNAREDQMAIHYANDWLAEYQYQKKQLKSIK